MAAEAGLGRPARLYLIGGLLGACYVTFHILGSTGSMVVLEAGGLILRDNHVPAWQAPWFGREISVLAQTLIPLLFFVPTGLHLRRNGSNAREARIGDGILIFAACMVLGSLLRNRSDLPAIEDRIRGTRKPRISTSSVA
ncbi:MAG: hypothetical protein ACOCXJ_04610, partial [Planctomycetota bacterium]